MGKFVEYYGPGLHTLTIADRATLGNMSPEYGATIGFFPVDAQTLDYLRLSRQKLEAAGVTSGQLTRESWASFLRGVLAANEFIYLD